MDTEYVTTSYLVVVVDEDERCAAPEVLGPAVDLHQARLALHLAAQDEHSEATFGIGFPEEIEGKMPFRPVAMWYTG